MLTRCHSPMSNTVAFTPVATSNENAETGVPPAPNPTRPALAHGASADASEAERAPFAAEFDDFQRGYGEALGEIREEDEGGAAAAGGGAGARGSRGERGSGAELETPLWQQDRRQSRNMMWM